MARQGRWSANQAVAMAATLVLMVTSQFMASHAAKFTVGDANGWDFGVGSWPEGKSFKAGDVLIFKYEEGFHNVAIVDANGYQTCIAASGSKILDSGNDTVTLTKGDNFFLCNFPGHCVGGMKITVHAA